ncbi:MAG TPA: guanylate kinase [bacterium]|nr:guanylate kinase [bacterium]
MAIGKKNKRGLLIVLSSPSGGGKTTIAHQLMAKDKNVVRSISCTTRKPRAGEKNGKDYFFVTVAKFKAMVGKKSFLEWAKVHQNFYGTPGHWVEAQLAKGKDVLFVIDVQGGKIIKRKVADALLLFIQPPSFKVLKQRLLGRQSESAEALKVRLSDARGEIKEGKHYDYRVINDRLSHAVSEVRKIIKNERKSRLKARMKMGLK